MNQSDRVKHLEAVQKDVTFVCFDNCFSRKNYKMDDACVQTCYQKYVHSLNHVHSKLIKDGRALHSEFVCQAVGPVPQDRFLDDIFPLGGFNSA